MDAQVHARVVRTLVEEPVEIPLFPRNGEHFVREVDADHATDQVARLVAADEMVGERERQIAGPQATSTTRSVGFNAASVTFRRQCWSIHRLCSRLFRS